MQDSVVTVLDVGSRQASVGAWSKLGKNLSYLGFEADKEECRRLNEMCASAATPWEEVYYPIALGRKNETRDFYVTQNPACSSLLAPNVDEISSFGFCERLHVSNVSSVETCTLSDWADQYHRHDIDFVKLDIQGAELEVMQASAEIVGSCLGLEVEVEFMSVYKNQPLFGDVDAWVKSNGYVLFDISRTYCKRTSVDIRMSSLGQLAWGDALYLKDVDHLMELSMHGPEMRLALLKLAAIADVLGRPDYAAFVLDRAIVRLPDVIGDELENLQLILSEQKTCRDRTDLWISIAGRLCRRWMKRRRDDFWQA